MNHFHGQIPKHIYLLVDSSFTHKEPCGFIPAVWFGLTSFPGRAWGCTVMLESGAIYRNLPPHALAFDEQCESWTLQQAQTWDCYGYGWSAIEYDFLKGLDCEAMLQDESTHKGNYLFSVAPIGDAYSEAPDQSKEFQFIRTWNGRLTIQPTNRVIFTDRSWNHKTAHWPTGLKTTTEIYSCE